jgi:hypothetical protein
MSFLFFFLLQNQRTGKQNRSCLGCDTSGWVEEVGKGYRGMNTVQILCTYECKWKKNPVETIPGMGREKGLKEIGGGGQFKYCIFIVLQEPL